MRGFDLLIGSDAAAAVDRAARISQLDFLVGGVRGQRAGMVVVVIVERDAGVVALDEAAGRRVVVIGGERQAGVFAQVVDSLHQAFAEGGFADDQRAVVILQCAGNDLRRRSRAAIDQHHDGEGLAAVAMCCRVVLIGIGASALRDDALSLGEQMVANVHRLAQQAAGVAAQIEDQALQIAEAVDRRRSSSSPVVSWNWVRCM